MKIANDFADVAQLLRGLKRRQDDAAEDRTAAQAANIYVDVRDTTLCYDRVETTTGTEGGFTWDASRMDYDEFSD